jgi:hypothetical protein
MINKAQMLVLLADNVTGDISAQDMRDVVDGLISILDEGQTLVYRDGSLTIDKLPMVDLPADPSFVSGTVYFKDGALKIMTNISGVTVEVGHQLHLHVYNDTGVAIPKGKIVRHDGVFSGVPKIALALADNFIHGRILGMTTHEIADGTYGLISSFGVVEGIDTDGVTTGVPLYLSDTSAGDYTETAPAIASQIGGALIADAADGKIFVYIENGINLPEIGAFYRGLSGTHTIDTTVRTFPVFDASTAMLVDVSSGNTFVVPTAGFYTITFTATLENLAAYSSGSLIQIDVYNETQARLEFDHYIVVGRSDTVTSGSFTIVLELAANDEISFKHSSNNDLGSACTFASIQAIISSAQIRE